MTVRVLPVEEWPRVVGQLAQLLPLRTAEDCQVLVVEHEGVIVGQWALLGYPHVEGIEIASGFRRRGTVARRLLMGMRELLERQGVTSVFTGAATPEVAQLLDKLGATPVPFQLYRWNLGGSDASNSSDHHGRRGDSQRGDSQEKECGAEEDGRTADLADAARG